VREHGAVAEYELIFEQSFDRTDGMPDRQIDPLLVKIAYYEGLRVEAQTLGPSWFSDLRGDNRLLQTRTRLCRTRSYALVVRA
jgi:hypothetical protein